MPYHVIIFNHGHCSPPSPIQEALRMQLEHQSAAPSAQATRTNESAEYNKYVYRLVGASGDLSMTKFT